MSCLFCLIAMVWIPAVGPAQASESDAPSIGCRLSPDALASRLAGVEELFAVSTERRELEDGYEFRFEGDPEVTGRLLDLVHLERQCCRFFRFELSFEPQQGPVWFRVRGSEQVKAFVEELMGVDER